jgi:hypothetical protein
MSYTQIFLSSYFVFHCRKSCFGGYGSHLVFESFCIQTSASRPAILRVMSFSPSKQISGQDRFLPYPHPSTLNNQEGWKGSLNKQEPITLISPVMDLRFSQLWLWRVWSSRIWRRVGRWVSTDVGWHSTDYTASYPRRRYSSSPVMYQFCGSIICLRWKQRVTALRSMRWNHMQKFLTKSYIFWDVTQWSRTKVNRRIRGTYSLYLQDRKVSQARNQ